MVAKLKIHNDCGLENEKIEFMHDVLVGLSSEKKKIPSKYFYDEAGSELFNQITRHPDYYLTACELEILRSFRKEIAQLLKKEPFNLIELGPGEGIKSRLLIEQFLSDHLSFNYCTIDISKNYLEQLVRRFNQQLPSLQIIAINSDFSDGIKWLGNKSKKRNFVLFLGSSIGNFNIPKSRRFLQDIRNALHIGDYMLISFDLRKDVDILLHAYNDSSGLTCAFNLNLLHRINRELQANFNIDSFAHYSTYNAHEGAMESFLISRENQLVTIASLNRDFMFEKFESIHVESSYKYLFSQIDKLAENSHFEIKKTYLDTKGYFVNSLWQAK
jgi:L-histidine N-alpha-methyltransferase